MQSPQLLKFISMFLYSTLATDKMIFKYLIFVWCLFEQSLCDKSFTIVLDTTKSMQDELDVLKANLPVVFESDGKDISNYILVPFNDPDVGEATISDDSADITSAINRITADGGVKCPENSLAGIEKALRISKQQSNIFVFTDAYPKDGDKLQDIENLCRSTRSQVVIFLTGYCLPSATFPTATIQVYHDVAKACSGMVINLSALELRQIFRYIKEIINTEWTDITSYDTFSGYKELIFTVDTFTKSVLLSVSSKGLPTILISPGLNSSSAYENIMDNRHTQIIRLLEATPGEYKISIRCSDPTSVVLYKQSQLPLRIGFSIEQPRSIEETSRRPLPGRECYILLEASSTFKIETVEIEVSSENKKISLTIEEIQDRTDLYMAKTFVEPDKNFRIWVNGYDKVTTQKISGSTEIVIPQVTEGIDTKWVTPKAKIIDEGPVKANFGTEATFACKVHGYPKSTVWWEDESGTKLTTPTDGVLLEIPSLYISYYHIENVTTNATISCKCKNSEGEDAHSIEVYVIRPHKFEIIKTPEDLTLEYGSEGKLYCEVAAYPEAEIKWYHNDTLVTPTEDVEIIPEEHALYLKRMSLNDVGGYTCEIDNEENQKTYTADVTISGLEAPQVKVDNSDVVLMFGNWAYLECRITRGKPTPELRWQFKSRNGEDFGDLPESVVVEDNKLKIAAAQNNQNGVFRCDAVNILGQNSAEITVSVKQPPTISNSDSGSVSVKEGDDVTLACDVTAYPAPTVYWEMTQDDVLLPLDSRHHTDDHYTHRFKALWKDSGNYHCVATNDVGRAEKTITVNVLVKPYIEPPRQKSVAVRAGYDVTLECNVSFGNPVPTTKWEFVSRDSTTRILQRSNSSSVLHINNVRYENEGSYMCIAENDVGRDSIKIYLTVQ